MPVIVKLPKIGLTMTEAQLVRWLVNEGDPVAKEQIIAEIETEKAVNEIPSPIEGRVGKFLQSPGAILAVAEPLMILLADGETEIDMAAELTAIHLGNGRNRVQATPSMTKELIETPAQGALPAVGKITASPSARRLAKELGVKLESVKPTGPGGSIVKEDILQAVRPGHKSARQIELGESRLEPFTPMRRAIIQSVAASMAIPHFSIFTSASAAGLKAVRTGQHDIAYDDMLISCAARALMSNPGVNAAWEEQGKRLFASAHIGMVVATAQGIVVPVIHNADKLALNEISEERKRVTELCRSRQAAEDLCSGGTFTISNLGMYPVDHFEAMLHPNQAAILSVGHIKDEPVVENGQIIVKSIVRFGLTLDHRVVDGAQGAAFLKDFIAHVESIAEDVR